jgi:Spy/CpxP family protein refolding chaperone
LEDLVKNLTQTLSLDATQQAKVKAILEYRQMQLHRVSEDKSLSAVDRFAAIKEIHKRADDQIGRILNPEQASKFEQSRHPSAPTAQPATPVQPVPPAKATPPTQSEPK